MAKVAAARANVKPRLRARAEREPADADAAALPRHDLLTEGVFGVAAHGSGRRALSLPDVLAALGRNEVNAFTALQAHQQHAWHAFLVQIAAIALHRAGKSEAKQTARAWRDLLLALTAGKTEPWTLVVPDLAKPAFMQPPVTPRSLECYGRPVLRPDEIDVLVTSKNHDVKMARVCRPRPEHWAYALLTLQTMEGYSGATRYGIARMNGGAGSRPGLGLARCHALGARFVRDVSVLLDARASVAKARDYARRGGLALLWLEPWDGNARLELSSLDPWFVEICRRVRLVNTPEGVAVRSATSKAPRVAVPEHLQGNTGDPWTPVERATGKAFTASDSGLGYRKVQELLGDDYAPGAAQDPRPGEKELLLIATVVPRGMGKTAGYHERRLPIPAKATTLLASLDGRAALAKRASARVDTVADVRRAVLAPALLTLLQGAPEKLDFKDERGRAWLDRLDSAVDGIFFERLWADLERDPDEGRASWALEVVDFARGLLRDACESAPIPTARRYRAVCTAEQVFEGAARRKLPYAYPEKERRNE
jgi:CRISPR system Cascade subunit CasA